MIDKSMSVNVFSRFYMMIEIPSLGYIKIAKIGIYLHSYGDFIRFFGI